MNRLQHLAEVEQALAPVRDLLRNTRMNVTVQFNPLMTQIALAYAHVHAIAALAADDPEGYGDAMVWTDETDQAVLAAAASDLPQITPPEQQAPASAHGLIIP